jgi:cell division septation protein DedD
VDIENQNQDNQYSEDNNQAPMTAADRKRYILELKAKKEAEKKAKLKEEKEEKRRKKMEERANNPGSKTKLPVIIISALIIVGIVGFFALKKFSDSKIVITPETEKQVEPITDSIIEEEYEEEVITEQKTTDEPNIKASNSTFNLPTPCWIVSYGSFMNEKYAQINTQKLKANGKNAGYYWIPDRNPRGNKFFKVYIGPFFTKADAEIELQNTKKLSPTAYILRLK